MTERRELDQLAFPPATPPELALEDAPAGTRCHAVGDAGVPLREISETIGRMLGLPAVSIAPENVAEHFAYLEDGHYFEGPVANAAA